VTRIFLVAGEASGDLHGASLIRALQKALPAVQCEGLGGHRMAEAGMALRHDLAGEAVMGFSEVVRAFASIRRVFVETAAYLEQTRPEALVLIDYPGFNMRLGKRAKKMGIPVIYYISPQVWAWKKRRVHTIAAMVEKMLVILPFEEKLYTDIGVDCTYVGHPLLDHIARVETTGQYSGDLVIGLLPGSREQEVKRLLGTMIEVAQGIRQTRPEARFVVACADEARERQVRALAGDFPIETAVGATYEVLDAAHFCLVASGTATLETALFGVPMVILYKVSPLSYWIARRVVDVAHIGLVNILAGRGIVPEFIQDEAVAGKVLPCALELIEDSPARRKMVQDLAEVRETLGAEGASERAAAEVVAVLEGGAHG